MKKNLAAIVLLILLIYPYAKRIQCQESTPAVTSEPTPRPSLTYLIDDFEDADIKKNPRWWGFGNLVISYVYNSVYNLNRLGRVSVKFEGKSHGDYLIGGCGTYFKGLNAAPFNAIQMEVHGIGKESGVVFIELFDDDNGNYQIEPHPYDKSMTMADDKFLYILDVNWAGWQTVTIPFEYFTDANPGIGDDKWNPNLLNDSGGLLQMQLIFLTSQPQGLLNVMIDHISLVRADLSQP